MKKLTSVVVLFACIFVLMPGAASAVDDFATWCVNYGLQWDGSTCTVGASEAPAMPYSLHIDPGQTLEIFGTVHIAFGPADYTIYSGGTINIHEGGNLHITPARTIQNNGTINNSGLIDNYGIIKNYGTIDNTGELQNIWSSTFDTTFENKGFVFNQHGHILNTGTISNTRCPGEVGVITAGPTNLDNYGSIEYINGQECW